MSKEELITAAEGSKLSDTPIRGNTNGWATARGAGKWYDGWSCIKVGVFGEGVCIGCVGLGGVSEWWGECFRVKGCGF